MIDFRCAVNKEGLNYMDEKIKLSVCALIICDGALLIVKRSENDSFLPGVWEFPGGGIEKGENIQDALIRELREETNLDISEEKMKLIGVSEELTEKKDYMKHDIQFNYEVVLSKKQAISLSQEHSAFDWIKSCDDRIDDFLRNILGQSNFCKEWIK